MKLDNRQSPWRKRIDRYLGIPLVILMAILRRVLFLRYWGFQKKRKRILLIKLSALGDVVLMLPSLYRLRESCPDAEIVFLGGASNVGFLKLCSAITRVETFSFKTSLKLLMTSYDLVIDYDQWVRITAIISSLCVARQTIGFETVTQFRHFAYDVVQVFDRSLHMAQNFWNLTQSALLKKGIKFLGSFEDDKHNVRRFWAPALVDSVKLSKTADSPFSVVHPGCGDNGQQREWPVQSWKDVISFLKASGEGPVVITGKGTHERELGEILTGEPGSEAATSLVDKLNLNELIMTLSNARRIIAGNTGVMHLADYLNDSVFVLEGPTDSALWGPLWKGKNIESPVACSPCLTWGHDYGCSDPICLKAITPKRVVEALESFK